MATFSVRLFAAAVALVTLGGVAAQAQYRYDDRYQTYQRQQRPSGGFFGLFGGPRYYGPVEQAPQVQVQVDSSKAPAPRKQEGTPTLSIMVMGDSMADWLGFGLEEAFAESPEIAIVRKNKLYSGLIRYEQKGDLDWWHVARDNLANQKVDFVVMMLGINDRTNIRETVAEKKAKEEKKAADKKAADKPDEKKTADSKSAGNQDAKNTADKDDEKDDDDNSIIAPETRGPAGSIAFRTDKWEEIYTKRIDETIAALKSKGVPVLWVGLPPLRGTRSTADVSYLNDLYRARAEKAGITYVDVWDGFVDETGKFTSRGPDFEGQIRLLRSGDGVHFTKNGARKLAHYVERDLRRFMSNRSTPVALPATTPQTPELSSGPAVRPVAGPVMPLTVDQANTEELLGGSASRPVHSDPTASRVLVKGEPAPATPGRADDFSWPRGGDPAIAEPLSPTAAAARGEPAAAKPAAKGAKSARPEKQEKPSAKGKNAKPEPAKQPAKPAVRAQQQPRPQQQPRSSGPFGWLR